MQNDKFDKNVHMIGVCIFLLPFLSVWILVVIILTTHLRKCSCLLTLLTLDFLKMCSSLWLYSFLLWPGSALVISQPILQSEGPKSFSTVEFLGVSHKDFSCKSTEAILSMKLHHIKLYNVLCQLLWSYVVVGHLFTFILTWYSFPLLSCKLLECIYQKIYQLALYITELSIVIWCGSLYFPKTMTTGCISSPVHFLHDVSAPPNQRWCPCLLSLNLGGSLQISQLPDCGRRDTAWC